MSPVNPLPALLILAAAVGTAALFTRRFGAPAAHGRFTSIDGLRGYLALCVFMHHSCMWYYYLRAGVWRHPPSHLYTHLGMSSVALFFMITGFLFFTKLIDARTRPLDWAKLFVSRILRLVPLYLFAMLLLFLVVAVLSKGTLQEPPLALLRKAAIWLSFPPNSGPDLNGIGSTSLIIADVTWSLPYEWFFYLALPLLALTVGVKAPARYLLLGLTSFLVLLRLQPQGHHLLTFLGGILAAFAARFAPVRRLAATPAASLLVLACMAAAIAFFPTPFRPLPLLLYTAAFLLIACGNTLFGLLVTPTSRALGDTAYSLYLLHGMMLYSLLHFVIGLPAARSLSPLAHWAWATGLTPVLVAVCFTTFRLIERPAMQRVTAATAWLRRRSAKA